MKLYKASREALNAFDEAARHWGLVAEHGYGREVDRAEEDYKETFDVLKQRLQHLEQTGAKLRQQVHLTRANAELKERELHAAVEQYRRELSDIY